MRPASSGTWIQAPTAIQPTIPCRDSPDSTRSDPVAWHRRSSVSGTASESKFDQRPIEGGSKFWHLLIGGASVHQLPIQTNHDREGDADNGSHAKASDVQRGRSRVVVFQHRFPVRELHPQDHQLNDKVSARMHGLVPGSSMPHERSPPSAIGRSLRGPQRAPLRGICPIGCQHCSKSPWRPAAWGLISNRIGGLHAPAPAEEWAWEPHGQRIFSPTLATWYPPNCGNWWNFRHQETGHQGWQAPQEPGPSSDLRHWDPDTGHRGHGRKTQADPATGPAIHPAAVQKEGPEDLVLASSQVRQGGQKLHQKMWMAKLSRRHCLWNTGKLLGREVNTAPSPGHLTQNHFFFGTQTAVLAF